MFDHWKEHIRDKYFQYRLMHNNNMVYLPTIIEESASEAGYSDSISVVKSGTMIF